MTLDRSARTLFWSMLCLFTALTTLPAPKVLADDSKGASLFDGKNLENWKGDRSYWSVEEGAIVGRTTDKQPLKHNIFLIYQAAQPADFELRLEFKIEGGNSGIQYRSKVVDQQAHIVGGYQADIDATMRYMGILYEERGRGILAERGQRVTVGADGKKQAEQFSKADELVKFIHQGKWNHYRIVAKGNRLQHYINDVLMMELTDNQQEKAATKGVIALQLHRGPPMVVRFKNIRCRKLE